MSRRAIALISLVLLATVAAVGISEVVLRARINHRLESRAPLPLEFSGTSAIVALATGTWHVSAGLDSARLASLLDERAPFAVDDVTLTDGALGIEVPIGGGTRDATVWLSLSPAPDGLEATVLSVEAGGFHLPPGALGDRATFTLGDPLNSPCPVDVDDVDITPDRIDVSITLSRQAAACLTTVEDR